MTATLTRRSAVARLVAASAATAFAARSPAAQPATHVVEINSFTFEPQTLQVKAGDTVTWINRDIAPHTATAVDKSWDTGKIGKGQQKSVIIAQDSETAYFCLYHPMMKASLDLSTS